MLAAGARRESTLVAAKSGNWGSFETDGGKLTGEISTDITTGNWEAANPFVDRNTSTAQCTQWPG